jgi:hypothetical protein
VPEIPKPPEPPIWCSDPTACAAALPHLTSSLSLDRESVGWACRFLQTTRI